MPREGFDKDNILKSLSSEQKKKILLQREITEENQRIENEGLADKLKNLKDGTSAPFKMNQTKAQTIGGTVALERVYGVSEPGGIQKILGVANPVSNSQANLFTVLGKHTCQISVLWVANRRLIPAKIRVGFDVAGGGTNIVPDAAWLYYQVEVPAESTLVLDAATGFWLGAADDVVVQTDVSGVSFGASGAMYATV